MSTTPPQAGERAEALGLFALQFHPVGTDPAEEGDYLLYNQCDGFHLASAWFDDGGFMGFFNFSSYEIPPDCYRAWAMLPTSHETLFNLFAKKPPALDSEGSR